MFEPASVDGTGLRHAAAPAWFASRAGVIPDPFWKSWHGPKGGKVSAPTYATYVSECREEQGALRWLVTLLAAINGLPRKVRTATVRPGTRTVGMYRLPYLGHSRIELEIPADNRMQRARRILDAAARGEAARRRWHTVRGHWRVVERGKLRPGQLCRHEVVPDLIEGGIGICARCEMLIRWVEVPNGRGSRELGIVDHAYRVTARRQRRQRGGAQLCG